jgi:hypothetical protein
VVAHVLAAAVAVQVPFVFFDCADFEALRRRELRGADPQVSSQANVGIGPATSNR